MNYRQLCNRIYWIARRYVAPSLQYSQTTYGDTLERFVRPGIHWADLGCGHQILPPWRRAQEEALVRRAGRVTGIDSDLPSLAKPASIETKICADIRALPLPDDSCDLVTANMVVEHLEDPVRQFREIHRVLKPGGTFLFHTPNTLGYTTALARLVPEPLKKTIVHLIEGRPGDDVFPTYYRANRLGRIREVAASSGFEIAEFQHILTEAATQLLPPVALVELLWIRLLMTRPGERLRTNLIVALRKQPA